MSDGAGREPFDSRPGKSLIVGNQIQNENQSLLNQEIELVQFIREAPEDLSRRLVYADWLEEQGDSQSEYIRLECQLAESPKTLVANQLRQRAAQIWRAGKAGWHERVYLNLEQTGLGDCRDQKIIRSWGYHRGCIESVTMNSRVIASSLESVLQVAPITTLRIAKSKSDRARLEHLSGGETLSKIFHLDLSKLGPFNAIQDQLVQLRWFTNLMSLRLAASSQKSSYRTLYRPSDFNERKMARLIFEESQIEKVEFQRVGHVMEYTREQVLIG